MEENFLHGYLSKDPEYEYLQDESDEMMNTLLVHFDMTSMLNNVFNSNEAVLILGPRLYSNTLSLMNERRTTLDNLYAGNTAVYEGRKSALLTLYDTDKKLEHLILAQISYLHGISDKQLYDEYMEQFFNSTPAPTN